MVRVFPFVSPSEPLVLLLLLVPLPLPPFSTVHGVGPEKRGALLMPWAGTDPFWTMLRAVSGKKRNSKARKEPPRMTKNQKTHLQPALSESTPPTRGPKLGPTFAATMAAPSMRPLSAGIATSASTP